VHTDSHHNGHTKWFLLFPTCERKLDPYTEVLNWWSVFKINFLYIIYTYTAYGSPIQRTTQTAAAVSIWCCCLRRAAACVSRVYDVMTMPLRRALRCINFSTPKKMGRQIPSIFCTGYSMDDPRKRSTFHENLTSGFWEIFWNRKYFFQSSPFTGGPDAKILVLSTQRPPTAQTISSPPDLPFWRYKGQSFNFLTSSPKIGWSDPFIFCTEYHSDDLEKPWKFRESRANSFRDIRHFTLRPCRLPIKRDY